MTAWTGRASASFWSGSWDGHRSRTLRLCRVCGIMLRMSGDSETEHDHAEPGRVCSWHECDTVLSIYNDSDRCHEHPHRKVLKHPRERKIRR